MLIAYVVYSAVWTIYVGVRKFNRNTEKQYDLAGEVGARSRELIQSDNMEELSIYLDAAMRTNQIHFYAVFVDGQRTIFANRAGLSEDFDFGQVEEDSIDRARDGSVRFYKIVEGPRAVVLGHKTSVDAFFQDYLASSAENIIKDIIMVVLGTIALILYQFRDLLLLVLRVRTRGGARTDASIAKSKEVLTLVQGLKGAQENKEALSKENAMLKGQVLPALQKELLSGKTPPYEFGCTLVRTDINNFSTIFATKDRTQFMSEVNEFFSQVAEIVSRYSGCIYEFIGDEVIYYFKDDLKNSSAIALTAIRDINKLADEFSERTQELHGYPFRIKTAISAGTLRFGPLVNGYSLAGSPLIESVRILSQIHDKSANTVLMDDTVYELVQGICTTEEFGIFTLKGVQKPRRLHQYQAHVPVIHHLKQGTDEHLTLATYYRSDSDIYEQLSYISENFGSLSREGMLKLLSGIRQYRVLQSTTEIKTAYVSLLERLNTDARQKDDKTIYVLSSLIATTTHLFQPGQLTGRLRNALLACLEIPERRVVANAVDVFTVLDPDASEPIFQKLVTHEDNRISANAMVKLSKQEWTKASGRRLRAMLSSQSAFHRSSALYALGEIAVHLKQSDEVAYQADLDLQTLLTEALGLVTHSNKLIRRQAALATIKSGRGKLLELQVISQPGLSPEIVAELQALLSGEDAEAKEIMAKAA